MVDVWLLEKKKRIYGHPGSFILGAPYMRNYIEFFYYRTNTGTGMYGRSLDEAAALMQSFLAINPTQTVVSSGKFYVLLNKDNFYAQMYYSSPLYDVLVASGRILVWHFAGPKPVTGYYATLDDMATLESPRRTWSHGE